MKALFTLLAGLVCFVPLIQAEDSTALSLPNCAVLCFSSAIQNSTCTVDDSNCICTDATLNEQAGLCVQSTCTVKESLTTMNISATECGAPVRDRSKSFDAITIIFGSSSLVAVILRVISRHWFNFSLGLDDVFIVGIVVVSANGFGRDVWTVPFQQITNVIRYSYVVQVMYFALIPLIKISILLFYLRLFVEPTIRKLVYMTIIANVVVGVIYVILNVFQCWPISYYWTEWDGEHVGRCINVVAIVNSYSGISIGVDIWMLILPATRVARLNMHWKKKIAVAIMFSVGIL
ncbi:putative integral membrane protein [Leptodontidium sp. MPI-SDFR-AT-0119]|nr:putative integral membrane protein [Leptodontidium sp. MPI-SDFR-AT-0119]